MVWGRGRTILHAHAMHPGGSNRGLGRADDNCSKSDHKATTEAQKFVSRGFMRSGFHLAMRSLAEPKCNICCVTRALWLQIMGHKELRPASAQLPDQPRLVPLLHLLICCAPHGAGWREPMDQVMPCVAGLADICCEVGSSGLVPAAAPSRVSAGSSPALAPDSGPWVQAVR